MENFEKRRKEMQHKMFKLEVLQTIYSSVLDKIRWEYMDYHAADDEHNESWFTVPEYEDEEDFYNYRRYHGYLIGQEVLKMIEKMADK